MGSPMPSPEKGQTDNEPTLHPPRTRLSVGATSSAGTETFINTHADIRLEQFLRAPIGSAMALTAARHTACVGHVPSGLIPFLACKDIIQHRLNWTLRFPLPGPSPEDPNAHRFANLALHSPQQRVSAKRYSTLPNLHPNKCHGHQPYFPPCAWPHQWHRSAYPVALDPSLILVSIPDSFPTPLLVRLSRLRFWRTLMAQLLWGPCPARPTLAFARIDSSCLGSRNAYDERPFGSCQWAR